MTNDTCEVCKRYMNGNFSITIKIVGKRHFYPMVDDHICVDCATIIRSLINNLKHEKRTEYENKPA